MLPSRPPGTRLRQLITVLREEGGAEARVDAPQQPAARLDPRGSRRRAVAAGESHRTSDGRTSGASAGCDRAPAAAARTQASRRPGGIYTRLSAPSSRSAMMSGFLSQPGPRRPGRKQAGDKKYRRYLL